MASRHMLQEWHWQPFSCVVSRWNAPDRGLLVNEGSVGWKYLYQPDTAEQCCYMLLAE